jgi:hypothetical protein
MKLNMFLVWLLGVVQTGTLDGTCSIEGSDGCPSS